VCHLNIEILLILIISIIIVTTTGIFVTWSYLLVYMLKSFRESPKLQQPVDSLTRLYTKISVIVPARNEEKYIASCLDGLIKQNYSDFEIILIDDSSEDGTWRIMQQYAAKYRGLIKALKSGLRPEGWTGKNWACYQGYLHCKGDLLLFTDADTQYSPQTLKLAENYLWLQQADAVTVIPRLLCIDPWTKITLSMLSVFLYTRFSALRVNNPKTKTGYFFGSFYLITRSSYEAVGTHKTVRHELVEDGALGAELKRRKFLIRMIRGESYIAALWARDLDTLWNGLRRLIIPLYSRNKKGTILVIAAVFILLIAPLILLLLSVWLSFSLSWVSPKPSTAGNLLQLLDWFLTTICILTVVLIFVCSAVQSRLAMFQSSIYALCFPIAAFIIFSSFVSSLIEARKGGIVSWRGRKYHVRGYKNTVR
jgi:chlorobactene glucosyltransferase